MLVYGDRWSLVAPGALLAEIDAALAAAAGVHGTARQDLLTRALIAAGELAQGVADAGFYRLGVDDPAPADEASLALAVAVARSLVAGAAPAEARSMLARLRVQRLPEAIRCRTAEGFAFYAVYPESYAAAVAAHRWEAPPLAIGLRSIGTTLAAVVAAATGGDALTLRPAGHPFRRELRPSPALAARIAGHPGPFAIADEGPGLSGSSFGAACDLLETLGVSPDRIVCLPSHPGDLGPQASPRHRARWSAAQRLIGSATATADAVARWFADLTGPVGRVDDLSGGAWRRHFPGAAELPAASATERLKFLLDAGDGQYIARFAGIGRTGEAKLAVAQLLHAAGFAPEPLALRRGFLLERRAPGPPLAADALRQPAALHEIARYLGLRARLLPATAAGGADLASLCEMARLNAAELGGEALGEAVAARLAGFERLRRLRPVRIDGRLQAWEWLRGPDGRLCKTDALDHAEAHDLVGCQDIAWDVAGAAVELGLSGWETDALRRSVGTEARHPVDPRAVAGFRLSYAAFQAGAWAMAADACPADAARLRLERDRYLAALRAAVCGTDAGARGLA
jgi:hypothetical protein